LQGARGALADGKADAFMARATTSPTAQSRAWVRWGGWRGLPHRRPRRLLSSHSPSLLPLACVQWEKFTTKPLVDSGEWRRVGECVTPWPCFMVAATNEALERFGPELLEALDVVRREAEQLEISPDAAETVGVMYGLEDDDVREWLGGTRWSCRAAVSHAMLQEVMEALAEVGVLEREKLLPPASLVAGLTADVDPDLITGEEDPWAR
jgi:hypothetical protein